MLGLTLEHLLDLLDLEDLEVDLFRGHSPTDNRDRIFGGQVLGQALVAARRTVEARLAHSLHGYFLRPGDPKVPILYQVDRIRDGRSFTTRRVVAIQKGRAIFNMSVSFHEGEEGFEHQRDRPDLAPPGGELYEDVIKAEVERQVAVDHDDRRFGLPIEIRTEEGLYLFDNSERSPNIRTWMRSRGPLPDDPGIHQCILAYASDLTVMVSAVRPHPVGMRSRGFRTASLDHAMWFHRPFRADQWLSFVQESPVSAGGRGFGRGEFFTEDGVLVASATQEGLMRLDPESHRRQR